MLRNVLGNTKKSENAHVTLSLASRKLLFSDVYQRRHIEACGVLLGSIDQHGNWQIDQAHPLPNIFNSPVYFEFAPEDLLEVELTYPGQIVGVYHSHPSGFATASRTDCANMKRVNLEQQIPWVWLIICGPFTEISTQQPQDCLLPPSVIAYHYYARRGLQKITIISKAD